MLNALVSFGLTQTDAEIYVYLATGGPQQADNIAEALETQRHNLHRSLETLKNRGVVTVESHALFSALPFDKALDQLMRTHLENVQHMEQNKGEILATWQAMIRDKTQK